MDKNKLSFRLLVVSLIISAISGAILRFAISLHVLDITGSPAIFATMIAVSFVPMIVFSPFGGAIVDRFSKKMMIVISDISKTIAVSVLAIMLIMDSGSVIHFGVVITIFTLVQTLYSPAINAGLPLILESDELVKANGIMQGINAVTGIASPMLGGLMFGLLGITNLAVFCAVFLLFSVVINIFIKIPHTKREMVSGFVKTILADMGYGFKYVLTENRLLFRAVMLFAVVVFFVQALTAISYTYMMRVTFALPEEQIGFASATIGISGLLASIFAGRLKKIMEIKFLAFYVAAIGFAIVPIAIAASFTQAGIVPVVLLVGGFMIISFVLTLTNILVITYTQINVPADMIGKVVSILSALVNLTAPLGQLTMGQLIEYLPDAQFILYGGIAIVLFAGGMLSARSFLKPENP